MIVVTTMDTTNMCHHIQTRRMRTQIFGILSHMFSNTMDHLEADDWITTIEQKLDMVQCNDRDKVLFASGKHVGAASA
jgi:hypothetical protein